MNINQTAIHILLLLVVMITTSIARSVKRNAEMEDILEERTFVARKIIEALMKRAPSSYCAKYSADNRNCEIWVSGGGTSNPSSSYSGQAATDRYGVQGDFSGYNKQCIDAGHPSWWCLNVGKNWIVG